jgi:transcriptional regulator with PAS, ATPase and Fis domain
MDYDVQAKLLRFLQDHEVQRVGAKSARSVDVRVIAATNREPRVQIENHKLREDFYYRLSVVSIEMAPLRERPGDLALLTRYFLDLAAAKYGKNMSAVATEAMTLLSNYDWPGNVRQLEHLIDQIVITNNSAELTADMLPAEIGSTTARVVPAHATAGQDSGQAVLSIEKMEQHLILRALELTSGSVREAASQLGLSEATLYRKMKKFGISRTFIKPQ